MSNIVSFMDSGQSIVLLALWAVASLAALVSLIHAAIQRSDAFPAVDRQTKVIWVAILAAATVFTGLFGAISLPGLIAIVAVLVYIVDVRPRVDSIQGRSWFKKV